MLKTNELRVLNYYRNGVGVDCIFTYDLFDRLVRGEAKCYGISLTEEWLMEFEFKKHKDFFGKGSRFTLWKDPKMSEGYICDWSGKTIKVVNYVHELQNLFFALTNEELYNKKLRDYFK